MLLFNWLFLPPRHSFTLADGENWLVLVLYLVVAVATSELASRAGNARRRPRRGSGRPAAVADIATMLLSNPSRPTRYARLGAHRGCPRRPAGNDHTGRRRTTRAWRVCIDRRA